MSPAMRPVGEDDLEAFVDERLDGERLQAVEALLEGDPALAARVAADRALRTALRERLAGHAAEPIPARLRVATLLARRRERLRRRLGMAAAAVLLLAVGAGVGWEAHGLTNGSVARAEVAEVAEAFSAHRVFVVEKLHPVEVEAGQQAHLVTWLSRRVGRPLKVPDLSAAGFQLMGGRVIPVTGQAAGQFMFEDGAGRRLTLFVMASEGGDTGFQVSEANGMTAFSWTDEGLGFAMVGSLDRATLLGLAEATYRQLYDARVR